MMNSKNGQITLYRTSGINEDKAMKIAEGKVKAYGYTASYPILLMVSGYETYFMLMHDDNNNLVGYSFVSYKDYAKAAVAESLHEAQAMYIKSWSNENSAGSLTDGAFDTVKGTISGIASEVIEGNTLYYVTINGSEQIYSLTSELAVTIVFAKEGDTIEISYIPAESECINAIEVKHIRSITPTE